jgi:pterin-4a-carbinolamine dehydratase
VAAVEEQTHFILDAAVAYHGDGDGIRDFGDRVVCDEHHLERDYKFADFRQALAFTNKVGELAEQQNHHPDIYLAWGKVKLTLWTHKIDGLTESDFIFAAKVDKIG